jgi:hypothetical protein
MQKRQPVLHDAEPSGLSISSRPDALYWTSIVPTMPG